MYKMLCLDLDDTLLMPDLTIPAAVQDKIRALIARGVIVTLSTGRMFNSAQIYARQCGIDAPLVVYNGAVIRSAGSAASTAFTPLPREICRKIFDLAYREGWYLQMYNDDCIVVDRICDYTRMDGDFANAPTRQAGDLRLAQLGDTPKVMTAGPAEEMPARMALLRQLLGDAVYIAASKPYLVEIMAKGVSKAQSLQRLCDSMGIRPEEVVACGDSTNDAEMIRWAGMGCVVANGLPEMRAMADYVTQAAYSYGVLEVMERFF